MSTRNKSKNKSSAKKKLFKENVKGKGPSRKEKEDGKKKKPVQLKQTVLESFSILKQTGDALQDDISEESFNPPLHSTAVFNEEEDLLEKTKASTEQSVNQVSSGPSVSQKKSDRKTSSAQKNKATASTAAPQSVLGKKQKTPQKPETPVQVLEASEKGSSSESKEEEETGSTQQTPPAEQATDKNSNGKTDSNVKEKETPRKKTPNKQKKKEQIQLTIWSPEDAPGTAKNVNELDVILFESEKLVEQYKESIDGASRKAVDKFFLGFKDQLTTSIQNVRVLKDLKRKNAKVRLEIGRKQRRLIEVKDEIIKKQPKLNHLQRECSELEEREKSIKNAKSFLDNLGQLQEDYKKRRTESGKETYGLSSLPALIAEAQSTMRAEQHFHNVNTQLENRKTQEK